METLRGFPAAVDALAAVDFDGLIASQPHEAYAQLLEDISRPVREQSQSFMLELRVWLAVARADITADRLVSSFSQDLSARRAKDLLLGLRPILVERAPGRFRPFHDDFVRFLEDVTAGSDPSPAHRAHAAALAESDDPADVLLRAHHLWSGGLDRELVSLVTERGLAELVELVSLEEAQEIFRYGLGAALRGGDDKAALLLALRGYRLWELDRGGSWQFDLPDPRSGIRAWTFVTAPAEHDDAGLALRAEAIAAACRAEPGDLGVAVQVVRRFALPDAQFAEVVCGGFSPTLDRYIDAFVAWCFRQGRTDDFQAAWSLAEGGQYRLWSAAVVALGGVELPSALDRWIGTLLALDYQPLDLIESGVGHLRNYSLSLGHAVAACARWDRFDEPRIRRARGALRLLTGTQCEFTEEELRSPLSWPTGDNLSVDEGDHFFELMLAAVGWSYSQRGKILSDLAAPVPLVEALESGGALTGAAGKLAWRVGVVAGLLIRAPALVTPKEILGILQLLLSGAPSELETHNQYRMAETATALLPILCVAIHLAERDEVIATVLEQRLMVGLHQPSRREEGLAEALWMLAPERWRVVAGHVWDIRSLRGSDGHGRREWFQYWVSRASGRGVDPPPEFVRRAAVAELGIPRKSYPSELAVELALRVEPRDERNRILLDLLVLLVRARMAPEGDRDARSHFGKVLASLLMSDPPLFVVGFELVADLRTEGDGYGGLPGEVVAACLDAAGSELGATELLALWLWAASVPGSYAHGGRFRELSARVADEFRLRGERDAVTLVSTWLPPTGADPSVDEVAVPTATEGREELSVDQASFTWFMRWRDEAGYSFLRNFVADGGALAWAEIRELLAERVVQGQEPFYNWRVFGNGVVDLATAPPARELLPAAREHLEEKVCWQPVPELGEPPGPLTMIDAVVRLVARGVRAREAEVVEWSLRAFGEMARHQDLAPSVEEAVGELLAEDSARLREFGLMIARELEQPSDRLRATARSLMAGETAWIRWLAAQLAEEEPEWPSQRAVAGTPLLRLRQAAADEHVGGDALFTSDSSVRENYVKRISIAGDLGEADVRRAIETEEAYLSKAPLPDRVRGRSWSRRSLRAETVGRAASTAAARFLAELPEARRGPLLATVARVDPWLALARPNVEVPAGWLRLATLSEEGGRSGARVMRGLGWAGTAALGSDSFPGWAVLADLCVNLLRFDAIPHYPWVTEEWSTRPFLPRGGDPTLPLIPLCFWVSLFTEINYARMVLVPRWNLPGFQTLSYRRGERPAWTTEDGSEVIVAYRAMEPVTEPDDYLVPQFVVETGWAVEPGWLHRETPSGSTLFEFRSRWDGETRESEASVVPQPADS